MSGSKMASLAKDSKIQTSIKNSIKIKFHGQKLFQIRYLFALASKMYNPNCRGAMFEKTKARDIGWCIE
jgi:hypothetical protein